MKWMKVIWKLRNMMIQEFQHFVECQLIEVMKMKIRMIQFDSIVNLIQMKVVKMAKDEKHDDPRISTFRGISIDLSDENENARDSIRVNREFDSNEIDESDLHL
jgi:hypothetical protein